jgi:hypothetical protein
MMALIRKETKTQAIASRLDDGRMAKLRYNASPDPEPGLLL